MLVEALRKRPFIALLQIPRNQWRVTDTSHQLASGAGWRVRVRRPEPGQGMSSGPARNCSASFRLLVPPFSAGTQPCVSCVLTSGACPCPAAEETPRTAANAPAEELR